LQQVLDPLPCSQPQRAEPHHSSQPHRRSVRRGRPPRRARAGARLQQQPALTQIDPHCTSSPHQYRAWCTRHTSRHASFGEHLTPILSPQGAYGVSSSSPTGTTALPARSRVTANATPTRCWCHLIRTRAHIPPPSVWPKMPGTRPAAAPTRVHLAAPRMPEERRVG